MKAIIGMHKNHFKKENIIRAKGHYYKAKETAIRFFKRSDFTINWTPPMSILNLAVVR